MVKNDVVKITVTGYQKVDGEKSEPSTVSTIGVVQDGSTEEGIWIKYDEAIEGYDGKVSNLLCVYKEEMTVKKTGAINSSLYLKQGETCMLHYSTPFGQLDMLVDCKQMDINIEENCISINAVYDMYQNKQVISENYLGINISIQKTR